jgi:predicted TIM-barrel fold metal-dependent hydrolase
MRGKIALEEHFVTAELEGCIPGAGWDPEEWRGVLDRLEDFDRRLEQMDELGIETAVISLGSDGIQGIADSAEATATGRNANDALAEVVAKHPGRLAGFAALPMQEPSAAADEAQRCVRELGFVGALVNGYSDMPDGGAAYYDAPEYLPFWERFAQLSVPFYLHPRNPLPGNAGIYAGREELLGPSWAYAVETGTHALRLITSGLFDRLPDLQIILGHLGEQLPFAMARLDQRIAHIPKVRLERSPRQVFRENFWITTSGNYHTPSLLGTILELGSQRVMFSADYPFERMADATEWFDALELSPADKVRIARANAAGLLGLD